VPISGATPLSSPSSVSDLTDQRRCRAREALAIASVVLTIDIGNAHCFSARSIARASCGYSNAWLRLGSLSVSMRSLAGPG
jgi:hypothetical protein